MPVLETAGAVIGGVNAVKQLFGSKKKDDARQVKQQGELNKVNAQTARELAAYENELKLKMWKDTNYGEQLKQAGMAGVSKAAAIGGGGAGVGQGASVGNVSGTGAADAASTQMAETQKQMAAAQIANLNADTEKKKVEADVTGGAGKDKIVADTNWQNIQNEIAGESRQSAIQIIKRKAEAAYMENDKLSMDNNVNRETQKAQIQRIQAEATGAAIENEARRQGITLDKAKVRQIANDITMRIAENETTKRGQDVSKQNMEELTEAMLWSAGINAAGGLAKELIGLRKGGAMETVTSGTTRYDKDGNTTGGSTSKTTRRRK